MDPRTFFVEVEGQQYGPADVSMLKAWVEEGRIFPETELIASETQERIVAKTVAGLFDAPPVAAPPSAPPAAAPPQYGYVPPSKPSRPWLPIVIICGVGMVFCCPILAAIIFPVFAQARYAAIKTHALSNMKQLSLATVIYCGDNNDHFPTNMDSAESARPFLAPYAPSHSQADTKSYDVFVSLNPTPSQILGDERLGSVNSAELSDPPNVMTFYDDQPWRPHAFLMGYADGHTNMNRTQPPTFFLGQPVQMAEPAKGKQ